MVGGAIWWWTASAVMPASRPPAAPSRCPVIDLVDETASVLRVLAEAALDGERLELVAVRRRGAVRVDVVDLSAGVMPALASAALITRNAPSPSSDGAVMWYASADMP